MTPYFEGWSDQADVFADFDNTGWSTTVRLPNPEGHEGETVLFAIYVTENYEGNAFVLFEKNGKFYEVNGSHCSCNGLEGQWDPEETSFEALLHRLTKGEMGRTWEGNYAPQLMAWLLVDPLNELFGVDIKLTM